MKKRILFFTILVFALTSCAGAALYQQIATVSSQQMRLSNDGSFRYRKDALEISYDFWSKNGAMNFVLTNNYDEDIYVDLSRSFIIVNGMTMDYYMNRSFLSSEPTSVVSSVQNPSAATAVTPKSSPYGQASGTTYNEKEGVWIPAHSSRTFNEFVLMDTPYRQCGLARNPKSHEKASVDFKKETTPYQFENRLTYIVGGEYRVFSNIFYISNYSNYPDKEAFPLQDEVGCDGALSGNKVKIPMYKAANRFYIPYTFEGNLGNSDRGREKK